MDPAVVRQFGITWTEVWLTVATATAIYVTMVVLSRVFGARQYLSSSGYDLAFVFGLGSLIGRVVLVRTTFTVAAVGLFTLFVLHAVFGWLHHHVPVVHRAIQNRPIVLCSRGHILDANLRRAHLSRVELYQQLRLQGRGSLDGVRAMLLERNGQISIIGDGERLDPEVFAELREREDL